MPAHIADDNFARMPEPQIVQAHVADTESSRSCPQYGPCQDFGFTVRKKVPDAPSVSGINTVLSSCPWKCFTLASLMLRNV